MLWWPARPVMAWWWHVLASGTGWKSQSRFAYSHAEESYNLCSNVSGGLQHVVGIAMQFTSGRERGNAVFPASASNLLDLEAQSGVKGFFLDDSWASHWSETSCSSLESSAKERCGSAGSWDDCVPPLYRCRGVRKTEAKLHFFLLPSFMLPGGRFSRNWVLPGGQRCHLIVLHGWWCLLFFFQIWLIYSPAGKTRSDLCSNLESDWKFSHCSVPIVFYRVEGPLQMFLHGDLRDRTATIITSSATRAPAALQRFLCFKSQLF